MRGIYLKVLAPCTDSVDLVVHPGRAVAAQPGLAGKLLSVMLMPLWYPMKALMCLLALVGVLLSATAFVWFAFIPAVVIAGAVGIVAALGGPQVTEEIGFALGLVMVGTGLVAGFLGAYASPKILHWSMLLIDVETDPNEKFEWKSVFERKMEVGGDDYAAGYVAGMSSMH
jgi:hypothetical protein